MCHVGRGDPEELGEAGVCEVDGRAPWPSRRVGGGQDEVAAGLDDVPYGLRGGAGGCHVSGPWVASVTHLPAGRSQSSSSGIWLPDCIGSSSRVLFVSPEMTSGATQS